MNDCLRGIKVQLDLITVLAWINILLVLGLYPLLFDILGQLPS